MALIRRDAKANAAGKGQAGQLPEELDLYPTLKDFLTLEKWSETEPRTTGSFSVFYQDGVVKVSLNDKDANKVAYVTLGAGDEMLSVIEEVLNDPNFRWSPGRDSFKKKK
jgi:hypothetical protein